MVRMKLQTLEFLWVRRYRMDRTFRGGFKWKRLHRIEFLPESDPDAFGFLNPDEGLLSSGSIGRLPRAGLGDDQDWRYYYVNFFVDRDMYMRTWAVESATTKFLFRSKKTPHQQRKRKKTKRSPNGRTLKRCNSLRSLRRGRRPTTNPPLQCLTPIPSRTTPMNPRTAQIARW
ncbi:hypothetical protein K438DRAFT_675328 [Mycena galopus ATCC 62051]|nr:hypothetical protein K438DRAFT_675328 [Mycena galopus ATCC 62051]